MSSENATRAAKMTTTTINAPMIVKMFSIFEKSFAFGICVVGGILQHSATIHSQTRCFLTSCSILGCGSTIASRDINFSMKTVLYV